MKAYTVKIIFLILFSIYSPGIHTFAQILFWQPISDGYEIYDLLYDEEQYLYFSGESSGGHYYIFRSSDFGVTWEIGGYGLTGKRLYRFAIDSTGILWGGINYGGGGIYKSTDSGVYWSPSLSTNDRIFSIAVGPNQWIWAGTSEGKIVYSSDNGNTWESDYVTDDVIWTITSNNLNHIFAGSANGEIFRTTDFGTTWELVYNNPPLHVRAIVIDDLNHIYANRSDDRHVSTDNGNTWITIPGPTLFNLYLDDQHVFYGGYLGGGYRSYDNCSTWNFIGPPHKTNAFAFVDSLVYAGTRDGVFLYDPSYQPYIGQNYFPLELGNKWQFNKRCNNDFARNTIYYVERDTIISNKKYFRLEGDVNEWVRYDNEENIFYLRWNNSDYIVMNYNLNEGSTFQHILFYSHQIKTASIIAPTFMSIFDSSYHSKGFFWSYYEPPFFEDETTVYSESIGESEVKTHFSFSGYQESCTRKMIRAIIYDSTGIKYYSDHVKPAINFLPLLVTNEFIMDWEFTVDHYYSHFDEYQDVNFIDSVLLFSYYSDGDTTIINNPINAINEPGSINYSISFLLDSMLIKKDYNFYYKIYAVDKGIVSEYSTSPDTGYYELIYDPNPVSTEENNKIISEYLLYQNYPNPFNPVTEIEYTIKEEGKVELIVFDVLGRTVKTLVNEQQSNGNYKISFDASLLSSGIYLCQLKVNDFIETKKMVLLR